MTFSAGGRLGPYEILSPLGAGGMGEVYKARDTRLGREVALKVLPSELSGNAERLLRFEQEARAASALNHPNIVVVYDVGRSESASYIAMELVQGMSLRDLMVPGPLPVKRILPLATQIAEGLARAHAARIVHRDLKPENVMVSEDGFVKIVDFGLAKLALPSAQKLTVAPTAEIEAPRTEAGVILGTVGYMSPEQAVGGDVDYRSDQFSLGSILYEMATGRRPFQGDSTPQTLAAIIEEEPPPVTSLRPNVPLPLVWIIERCLAKAAAERYESTRDLARDLANLRDRASSVNLSGSERPSGTAIVPPRRQLRLVVVGILAAGALAAVLFAGLGVLTKSRSSPLSFQPLTFRAGEICSARFAPDGETVVYAAAWDGSPFEVFLTRRGSTEARPLGMRNTRILSISPSGEMAVLIGGATAAAGTLARVPLSGGVPRELLENVWDADWVPDGLLAAVTRNKDRSQVQFPLRRTIYESTGLIWELRVSPRGDRVACLEGPSWGSGDVILLDRSGKKTTLSRGWKAPGGLAWSARGDEVWFTGTLGGEPPSVHAVSLSGKERVLIRSPSPLRLTIADVFRDRRMLMVGDVDRGGIVCLPPGEIRERSLGWLDYSFLDSISADGRTLLFTEGGAGGAPNGAVYLRRTDGSPAVRLGDGQAEGLSPDGKWALVTKDYQQWALLPTGPGAPRTLQHGAPIQLIEGDFLDARRIVYSGREKQHEARVYIQDIEGGKPRPLTPEGVDIPQNAAVTPDRKFVLTSSDKGWFLYPVDGGAPRPVPPLLAAPDSPVGWSADGRKLYVRRGWQLGSMVEIDSLDLASGQRQAWKTLVPPDPSGVTSIGAMAVAPTENYCYSYERDLSTLNVVDGLP